MRCARPRAARSALKRRNRTIRQKNRVWRARNGVAAARVAPDLRLRATLLHQVSALFDKFIGGAFGGGAAAAPMSENARGCPIWCVRLNFEMCETNPNSM